MRNSWVDYEEVIHDTNAMFTFNRIYSEIEHIFRQEFDLVWLIQIYGKVLVNSFAIQDQFLQPIGRAVYLG